jgi:hypothetical protein
MSQHAFFDLQCEQMASKDPKEIETPSPAAPDSGATAVRSQKNNQTNVGRHPEPEPEKSPPANSEVIQDTELSHARLLEAVRQRMLLLDIETGRVNDVNSALIKVLGFFPTEIVGTRLRDLARLKRSASDQAVLKRLRHGTSGAEINPDTITCRDSQERAQLEEEIAQIQNHARSLHRARRILAALTAIAVAGFSYMAILLEHFPDRAQQVVLNFFCALGVGSLFSLLVFALLGMACRKKLDKRRLKYYNLVATLLSPHISGPK